MEIHALSSLHPPSLKYRRIPCCRRAAQRIRRYFLLSAVFLLLFLFPFLEKFGAVAGGAVAIWANYFWVRQAPDGNILHVCYMVPITLGVLTTLGVGVLTSFCFAPPRREQLRGLNIWHLTERERNLTDRKAEQ